MRKGSARNTVLAIAAQRNRHQRRTVTESRSNVTGIDAEHLDAVLRLQPLQRPLKALLRAKTREQNASRRHNEKRSATQRRSVPKLKVEVLDPMAIVLALSHDQLRVECEVVPTSNGIVERQCKGCAAGGWRLEKECQRAIEDSRYIYGGRGDLHVARSIGLVMSRRSTRAKSDVPPRAKFCHAATTLWKRRRRRSICVGAAE